MEKIKGFFKGRKKKEDSLVLCVTDPAVAMILSFALPVFIMLIIFVIRNIYPAGNGSFLCSDMWHQYMPFLTEFVHRVKEGAGLDFSFNIGMGENFYALYVYYLASPLNWLVFLFPERLIMEFMSYLVIIRIGLCGLTSYIYLQKSFKVKNGAAMFFSVFYALSGFMAAYNWDVMWLDCIVLLPLICLGLEKLVKEKKPLLYCITLFGSILTNFYLSIPICFFLVIYFAFLFFTEKKSIRSVLQFAIYSVLAGAMAAVLVLPVVCALLGSDFGAMEFPSKVSMYFDVLDMLSRHCMCVFTERGLDHWPNIYCGVCAIFMVPLYLTSPGIPMRKKFGKMAICGFFLLSFSTNVLDFIWHGFNYPDSLPARQSFIYIFIVISMCYEAFLHIKENEPKNILYSSLAAVLFILFVEKFVDSDDFELGVKLLTLVFILIEAALLYVFRTKTGKKTAVILGWITMITVVLEAAINTYDTSVSTTDRAHYLGLLKDYDALVKDIESKDTSFYRFEKFNRRTKNDSALANYPSASVFSSTLNSDVMHMYEKLGMRHSKVFYGFDGATPLTSAMLNVKYMFAEQNGFLDRESPLYTLLESSGEVAVYESKYTLPFGYVAPYEFELPKGYNNSPIQLQIQTLTDLGISSRLFTKVSMKDDGKDGLFFKATKTGDYYGLITSGGTSKIRVVGGHPEDQEFNDLKDGAIVYLGHLDADTTIYISNSDSTDQTPKIYMHMYYVNEGAVKEAIDLLSERHLENVVFSDTHFTGDLHLDEPGRLIISIPKENGWKAYINGEETEIKTFAQAMMAFDLNEGDYKVELKYVPQGKIAGIIISLVSVLIFVGIVLANRKKCYWSGKGQIL